MGRLHDLMYERYLRSWSLDLKNIDPTSVNPKDWKYMQAAYGSLVSSLPDDSRVLDLGCGTGGLLYWLSKQPDIQPVGIDLSPSMVEVINKYIPDAEAYCGDGLEFLREHPETFNGIFCKDVLEHLPDEDTCLEWIETALKALVPGGFFYCRVPNAANFTSNQLLYNDLTHHRCFARKSLLMLLEVGGFSECAVIPVRPIEISDNIRLCIESFMHKVIYRICGNSSERVFTRCISAVGFKH